MPWSVGSCTAWRMALMLAGSPFTAGGAFPCGSSLSKVVVAGSWEVGAGQPAILWSSTVLPPSPLSPDCKRRIKFAL